MFTSTGVTETKKKKTQKKKGELCHNEVKKAAFVSKRKSAEKHT